MNTQLNCFRHGQTSLEAALKWDVDKKKVYVSLDWGNADEINIVCGKYEIEKIGHERQS